MRWIIYTLLLAIMPMIAIGQISVIGGGSGYEYLDPDAWSPSTGAITMQDQVSASLARIYGNKALNVLNTGLIILSYNGYGPDDAYLESREIDFTNKTISGTLDSWEYYTDESVLMFSNGIIGLDDSFPPKLLCWTIYKGATYYPYLFTTSISLNGIFSDIVRDDLIMTSIGMNNNRIDLKNNGLVVEHIKDSLFVVVSQQENTGDIRYTSIVADWDGISANQDHFQTVNLPADKNPIDYNVFAHKDDASGDSIPIIVTYSVFDEGNVGTDTTVTMLKTFLTVDDTMSSTFSSVDLVKSLSVVWPLGLTFGSCKIHGGDYIASYIPVDSSSICPLLKISEADTIDNTIINRTVDDWLLTSFASAVGVHCDIAFVPRSDSLLFAVHTNIDTIFANILSIDPTNGSIHESVMYSDTLISSYGGLRPDIEYIRDGFFFVATSRDAAGIELLLYEVD